MGLLEDLTSGKYNLVLFGIIFILFFHQYWCSSSKTKELMTNVSNDIKEAVKQVYLADVEAIRNLSDIATKINAGTFVFPGNLNVTGTIKANGEISNNSFSLSGLNNSIINVNSSLTNSINNQISNVNSKMSSNYSDLDAKIKEFDSEYIWGNDTGSSTWRCRKPCDTGAWQRINGAIYTISATGAD